MRKHFICLVLAGGLSLATSLDVRAGAYTWAHVSYEPEVSSMRAFVGTQTDYGTAAYYCAEAYGYVLKTGSR